MACQKSSTKISTQQTIPLRIHAKNGGLMTTQWMHYF